jgi:hypothetical protein
LKPVELRVEIGDGLELRLRPGLESEDVLLGLNSPPDLRPEPRPEATLARKLDTVLLGERDGHRWPGDETALDEDGAQQAPGRVLFGQRPINLFLADETLGEQQLPEGTPALLRSFHAPSIGARLRLHKS